MDPNKSSEGTQPPKSYPEDFVKVNYNKVLAPTGQNRSHVISVFAQIHDDKPMQLKRHSA